MSTRIRGYRRLTGFPASGPVGRRRGGTYRCIWYTPSVSPKRSTVSRCRRATGWSPGAASRNGLVRAAAEIAGQVQPQLDLETESSLDAPIPLLLQRSESTKLLTVGLAGRGVLGDLLLGSTAAALAARPLPARR